MLNSDGLSLTNNARAKIWQGLKSENIAKTKVVEKHRRQSNSLSANCCKFTSHWNPSTLNVEKLKQEKVKIFLKEVIGFKHTF